MRLSGAGMRVVARSKSAITCDRDTEGNPARNSSMESPASRYSSLNGHPSTWEYWSPTHYIRRNADHRITHSRYDNPTMPVSKTASNDEVERRAAAPTSNEADLSRSSIPSLAHRK